jgi:hypothetical protein
MEHRVNFGLRIADCEFEIDEVSVFRFQILCLFFLTPETWHLTP